MHQELTYVEEMLDEDAGLEDIEMYIETCSHLPADARRTLWLLAWAETRRHERRRAVGELVARTAHDLGARST